MESKYVFCEDEFEEKEHEGKAVDNDAVEDEDVKVVFRSEQKDPKYKCDDSLEGDGNFKYD